MIASVVSAALLVLVQASPVANPVSTQRTAAPQKALQFEVVVPASLDDVWQAMSTKAGSWRPVPAPRGSRSCKPAGSRARNGMRPTTNSPRATRNC